MNKLIYINSRNNNLVSKFNVKFFRKFLTAKLLCSRLPIDSELYNFNLKSYLVLKKKKRISINFYSRREYVPFRILRYYSYFSDKSIMKYNLSNWILNKFSVYNGKKFKYINIYRGGIEKILKCKFRFGDFIFTRSLHFFRKKK